MLAKVGAEGIYSAAVVPLGLGIALKVEGGDGRCSPPALLLVLRELMARSGGRFALDLAPLAHHAEPPLRTTRGEQVGSLRARGPSASPEVNRLSLWERVGGEGFPPAAGVPASFPRALGTVSR